jgi:hypothetical protein
MTRDARYPTTPSLLLPERTQMFGWFLEKYPVVLSPVLGFLPAMLAVVLQSFQRRFPVPCFNASVLFSCLALLRLKRLER